MNFLKALKPVMVVVLMLLLVAAAVLFYQTRSDYYARVSVGEAVRHAKQVLAAVQVEHGKSSVLPASLEKLSLPPGQVGYVPTLAWNGVEGELTVKVDSDHGHFGTLFFRRVASDDGEVQWRCRNGSVDERYLPGDCRS